MRVKIFGRIFYIPLWIKILLILIIFAVLVALGYTIRKDKNILKDNPDLLSSQTAHPTIENTVYPSISNTPVPTSVTQYIKVYIIGCVNNPSVVKLAQGSIVQDAVDASGGLTKDADPTKINMAYPLSDNMMIKVPSKADTDDKSPYLNENWIIISPPETTPGSVDNSSQEKPFTKININTADIKTLCNLPGIGESTAQKIIDFRNQNGSFEYIEDIMKIPGIKQSRFDTIKDLITVG